MTEDSANNSSSPPLPADALDKPVRLDLIETAVKFLQDSQVKTAPLSKKLAFLESKGLTLDEINMAILKATDNRPEIVEVNKQGIVVREGEREREKDNQPGYKGILVTAAVIIGTGSLIISNYQSIKTMASGFISSILLNNRDGEIERVEKELKESIDELKKLMEEKERNLQEILMDMKRRRGGEEEKEEEEED